MAVHRKDYAVESFHTILSYGNQSYKYGVCMTCGNFPHNSVLRKQACLQVPAMDRFLLSTQFCPTETHVSAFMCTLRKVFPHNSVLRKQQFFKEAEPYLVVFPHNSVLRKRERLRLWLLKRIFFPHNSVLRKPM